MQLLVTLTLTKEGTSNVAYLYADTLWLIGFLLSHHSTPYDTFRALSILNPRHQAMLKIYKSGSRRLGLCGSNFVRTLCARIEFGLVSCMELVFPSIPIF